MMKRIWLLFLFSLAGYAQSPIYGRIDYTIQNAQGQAISGAQVYILTQPANTLTLTPTATLYGSTTGTGTANCGTNAASLPQPLTTDGFGHVCAYASPGQYTYVVVSPFTGQLNYPDQNVFLGGNNGIIASTQYQVPCYQSGGTTVGGSCGGFFDSSGNLHGVFIGNVTGHASLDLPLTGGTLTGVVNANDFVQNQGSLTINPKAFGAVGDGSTDDGNAMIAMATFINTQPALHIVVAFPPGVYAINAFDTHSHSPSNTLMNITATGVTFSGPGATLRLINPGTPYNQQFSVATGTTLSWNYIAFAGATTSGDSVYDLTFDSNGSTQTTCSGTYGCFWGTAIYEAPTSGPSSSTGSIFARNHFLKLEGWPVLTSANNTLIQGNYAEKSMGMVCQNGVTGCNIIGNTSINSEDAPYAVNGSSSLYVSKFTIANNVAIGNGGNGSGIDVTAAEDGVVSGNTITGSGNWCIQVDKTNGSYSEGAAGTYIPSQRVNISGNYCSGNNTYGGWPVNAEILVGDAYTANGGTPWTAGQTATDITVSGNSIEAFNPGSNDIGVAVGFGAGNVRISGNYINGCGTASSGTCAATPIRIQDVGQSANIIITNNHQDAQYTGQIKTGGPGPYEMWGNNIIWNPAGGSPTNSPQIVEGSLQVGDKNAFAGNLNMQGSPGGPLNSGVVAFTDSNGLQQGNLAGSTTNQQVVLGLHSGYNFVVTGGNTVAPAFQLGASGPTWTTTAGVPTANCAVGSIDSNTSAASASTAFYVCYPANTWNAVTIP